MSNSWKFFDKRSDKVERVLMSTYNYHIILSLKEFMSNSWKFVLKIIIAELLRKVHLPIMFINLTAIKLTAVAKMAKVFLWDKKYEKKIKESLKKVAK